MKNRRDVIKAFAALSFSAVAPLRALADAREKGATVRFGAQTNAWAIDPANQDSFFAVLDQVKLIGYDGFETGFRNLSGSFDDPSKTKQRIAATGLEFFGIHVFLPPDQWDATTRLPPSALIEKVARGGKGLGAQRIILSGAAAATPQQLKAKIEALNQAGQYARSVGLGLAYHNHWWEFQSKLNEIEELYTQTDPARVSFLLDAGHAYRGGAQLPDFLRKHAQRIVAVHFRDYREGHQVPLGQGTFPLAEVATTLKQLHWSGWALNEEEREDNTKGGRAFIEPAYAAMRGAFAK
jgi:sugar phosphate isomerase/epimerase